MGESRQKEAKLQAEIKKQKAIEIEQKAKEARDKRVEREKQEKIEAEKLRRSGGKKKLVDSREFEQMEMMKRQQKIRDERNEDKKARAAIKMKIEEDKRRRIEERENKKKGIDVNTTKPEIVKPIQKTESDKTRIQIKFPDGSRIVETFKSKENLSALCCLIKTKKANLLPEHGDFVYSTMYPKRTFGGNDQFETLESLGLVPSGTVVVSLPN